MQRQMDFAIDRSWMIEAVEARIDELAASCAGDGHDAIPLLLCVERDRRQREDQSTACHLNIICYGRGLEALHADLHCTAMIRLRRWKHPELRETGQRLGRPESRQP